MDGVFPIVQAAFGIGLLIFIHELGHFLAARAAGVRVEVFSLGFGPRLLGFVRDGCDYRLSLVPLGGYVAVAGMDTIDRTYLRKDDLHAQSFGARALFFSGGVLMNLLFALIAFPIVFKTGVQFTAPVIGMVEPGSPAWRVGLRPGDRVLTVAGKEMYSFENFRVEVALAGRKDVDLEIDRNGERIRISAEPEYSERLGLYVLGVSPAAEATPLRVESVGSSSPAAEAGLRRDDRIVAIDSRELIGRAAARALETRDLNPDQPITLTVERAGQRRDVTFTPATVKADEPQLGVSSFARRVIGLRRHPALRDLDLRTGDVIAFVDGERLGHDGLERFDVGGDRLELYVRRGDDRLTLSVQIDPEQRAELLDAIALGIETERVAVQPVPRSAAAHADILPGDVIVAVDGQPVATWDELKEHVSSKQARPMQLSIERERLGAEPERLTKSIQPARTELVDLGFVPQLRHRTDLYQVDSVGGAISAGFVASVDLVKSLYVTLKRLVTGDVSARNLGGIIQISRVSYHYAQSGWAVFFYFLGLLSINLAFINVLPIPVLDGGHLMFLLIEKVKGSPVSAKVHTYSQVLGLVFVIALMVFVTYNDILKLL